MRSLWFILLLVLPGLCVGQNSFEGLIHYEETLYDPATNEVIEGPNEWSARYVKGMKYYFVMPHSSQSEFDRGFVDYEAGQITMFSPSRRQYFVDDFGVDEAVLVPTDCVDVPKEWDATIYRVEYLTFESLEGLLVTVPTTYDNIWWFEALDYGQSGAPGTYGFLRLIPSIGSPLMYRLVAVKLEPREVSPSLFEVPEGYKRLKKVPKEWR